MKSTLALISLAAAMLLAGCATQPPQVSSAERTASLQCEGDLAYHGKYYDELFLKTGRPVFDEHRNPQGLNGLGFVAYHECMGRKGYQIAEGAN